MIASRKTGIRSWGGRHKAPYTTGNTGAGTECLVSCLIFFAFGQNDKDWYILLSEKMPKSTDLPHFSVAFSALSVQTTDPGEHDPGWKSLFTAPVGVLHYLRILKVRGEKKDMLDYLYRGIYRERENFAMRKCRVTPQNIFCNFSCVWGPKTYWEPIWKPKIQWSNVVLSNA